MEITLEKIELVKDRTGVSYKEAKEALEAADGSVVDAIINIEETIDANSKVRFTEYANVVVEKIKELVKKGNVSKISVKKDDEVILNLPVSIGILGTVIAPFAMLVGVIAAFGTKCVIEVIKDDGSIIDVSEMANEAAGYAMEKGSAFADDIKEKGQEVYESVKEKSASAFESVKEKTGKGRYNDGCCCDDACDFEEDEDCCCGCDCQEKHEEK